ncbi:MAG: hypothetical protein K8F59_03770 [Rhodobacteraceae bacterium]|nr:hypothetical protein [Paracoccaceae bacterium]
MRMKKDGKSNKAAAQSPKAQAAAEREARLAAALRANLHRRKGQSRARIALDETDETGQTGPDANTDET